MLQSPGPVARGLAAVTFLSTIFLAGPLSSAALGVVQASDSRAGPVATVVAQATTPEATPTPPRTPSKGAPGRSSRENRVEARINELHRQLKITAAQESQWNDFAQVMRENAQAVDAVLKERSENLRAMNAVEDLRSYEKLADAHAEGLKKLIPTFEALYNTMSDEQKKNADAVFGKHERRPHHAGK